MKFKTVCVKKRKYKIYFFFKKKKKEKNSRTINFMCVPCGP